MSDEKRNAIYSLFKLTIDKSVRIHATSSDEQHPSRLEDYLKKIVILKQIMSNKSRRYKKVNAAQNFATVAVSSILLFFGFSGIDKITNYVAWIYPSASKEGVELVFNLAVFFLFVIGTLHLVFRFSDKQSQSERAIAALASLANEIEDIVSSRGNLVIVESSERINQVRARYESITENLPANSDREFLAAKRDLIRKEERKPRFQVSPQQIFNPTEQQRIVATIILGSRANVDALQALRAEGHDLYLGGGLVRNAVWDYLHGYKSPTAADDVDVIYFNKLDTEKRHDQAIEDRLSKRIPNVRWSVKNQARMHTVNNEEQYDSLAHAIERWPETATAFAARLHDSGHLEIIAPHGFDDLLRLIVRSTPAFHNRQDVVQKRCHDKSWLKIWPHLRLIG